MIDSLSNSEDDDLLIEGLTPDADNNPATEEDVLVEENGNLAQVHQDTAEDSGNGEHKEG